MDELENNMESNLGSNQEEGTSNLSADSNELSFESRVDTSEVVNTVNVLRETFAKVVVGQRKMLDLLIVALLADGHVLLEGVPGIAKTLTVKTLSKMIDADYKRIQFTPDLMPADVLGTQIFNMKTSEFEMKKGPIFSNIVLIDEINRAPAKTQSALFEVMEEKQVTMDGETFKMNLPYFVIATQNPIEQEGTYKLPEAQLDRFLFKIILEYPSLEEEIQILEFENKLKSGLKLDQIVALLKPERIIELQSIIKKVVIEPSLISYIAKCIENTRNNKRLYLGASPRASIAILNASKVYAAMEGRDFVTPDDIKFVAVPVLQHRVVVSPEQEMEGVKAQEIIQQIMNTVEIPR